MWRRRSEAPLIRAARTAGDFELELTRAQRSKKASLILFALIIYGSAALSFRAGIVRGPACGPATTGAVCQTCVAP